MIFLHFLLFTNSFLFNFANNLFHYYIIFVMSRTLIYIYVVCATLLSLTSCQESLQDKAVKDAKDFTRKYCPTPVINYMRTDSVVFYKDSETYVYYCSFCNELDNEDIISQNEAKIKDILRSAISESTNLKPYVEAGFKFRYVCHSDKEPKKVMLEFKL